MWTLQHRLSREGAEAALMLTSGSACLCSLCSWISAGVGQPGPRAVSWVTPCAPLPRGLMVRVSSVGGRPGPQARGLSLEGPWFVSSDMVFTTSPDDTKGTVDSFTRRSLEAKMTCYTQESGGDVEARNLSDLGICRHVV